MKKNVFTGNLNKVFKDLLFDSSNFLYVQYPHL
jgi:hypothetical protein